MSARSSLAEPARVFGALGDPTRLALVSRLCDSGPQSATRLTTRSGVTRQAVNKHLAVLERAGLIRGRRRGRERVWEVEPGGLDRTRAYLDVIARQWDDALARLKLFVERPERDGRGQGSRYGASQTARG